MGAAASQDFVDGRYEAQVQVAFNMYDEGASGRVREQQLRPLVEELVLRDDYLQGCGPDDINELTQVLMKKYGNGRTELTYEQFRVLYYRAVLDVDNCVDFLRLMWSELGIQRMKAARKEWAATSKKRPADKQGDGNAVQYVLGGLFDGPGLA